MANTDNECKDLEVHNLQSKDFDRIFEMQSSLQKKMGYDFKSMTLQEIAEFWTFNKHAIDDEFSEMFDALGGVKDGIGNSVWKKWKSNHEKGSEMDISSLTENDRKELYFEVVDAFHFMINFAISIGMTGSNVFSMYMSKNKENFKRQENGY